MAMAAWFRRQANLDASRPVPVSIGGLRGVLIDLRTKQGSLVACTVDGQQLRLAGIFSGVSPSSLDHAVIPGMTMRLMLLSSARKVLVVELDDIDDAPGGLASLTAVARNLKFGS